MDTRPGFLMLLVSLKLLCLCRVLSEILILSLRYEVSNTDQEKSVHSVR